MPSVDSGPKILDDMAYEFRAVSCKEDVAIYSSIDYKLSINKSITILASKKFFCYNINVTSRKYVKPT